MYCSTMEGVIDVLADEKHDNDMWENVITACVHYIRGNAGGQG